MSKHCKPNSQLHSRAKSEDPPRHLGYKLVHCKFCNRTFFKNRIEYHEKVCQSKFGQLKRPVYDAPKFRLSGTGAEHFQIQNMLDKPPLNAKWKELREEFQSRLKTIKGEYKSTIAASAVVAKSTSKQCAMLGNYVQCPICGRRFNEQAAFHHIPNCTNYVMMKKNGGSAPRNSRADSLIRHRRKCSC